jgi:hypothetical protein
MDGVNERALGREERNGFRLAENRSRSGADTGFPLADPESKTEEEIIYAELNQPNARRKCMLNNFNQFCATAASHMRLQLYDID